MRDELYTRWIGLDNTGGLQWMVSVYSTWLDSSAEQLVDHSFQLRQIWEKSDLVHVPLFFLTNNIASLHCLLLLEAFRLGILMS